jgi:hypothetical protein
VCVSVCGGWCVCVVAAGVCWPASCVFGGLSSAVDLVLGKLKLIFFKSHPDYYKKTLPSAMDPALGKVNVIFLILKSCTDFKKSTSRAYRRIIKKFIDVFLMLFFILIIIYKF